jgi:hypothetical protein
MSRAGSSVHCVWPVVPPYSSATEICNGGSPDTSPPESCRRPTAGPAATKRSWLTSKRYRGSRQGSASSFCRFPGPAGQFLQTPTPQPDFDFRVSPRARPTDLIFKHQRMVPNGRCNRACLCRMSHAGQPTTERSGLAARRLLRSQAPANCCRSIHLESPRRRCSGRLCRRR